MNNQFFSIFDLNLDDFYDKLFFIRIISSFCYFGKHLETSINPFTSCHRAHVSARYSLFDILRQVALHISSRANRRGEAAGALEAAARIYVKPVVCFTRNGNDESFRALFVGIGPRFIP